MTDHVSRAIDQRYADVFASRYEMTVVETGGGGWAATVHLVTKTTRSDLRTFIGPDRDEVRDAAVAYLRSRPR